MQIQLRSRAGILLEAFPNPENFSPSVLGKKGSIYYIGLSFLSAIGGGTGRSTPVLFCEQTPPLKPAEKSLAKSTFFPVSELSLTLQEAHSVHALLLAAGSGHSIPLQSESCSAHILGKELHLLSQWPTLKPRDNCQTCPRAAGWLLIRHLVDSTKLIRPYLAGSGLVRSSRGVLRRLPLKQTKQERISKQCEGRRGPCVPQLQSCEQAGGLWKHRKTGEKKGCCHLSLL